MVGKNRDFYLDGNELLAALRRMKLDLYERVENGDRIPLEFIRGHNAVLNTLIRAVEAAR